MLKSYTLTIEKSTDNGETWSVQTLAVKGNSAAIKTAKALAGAANGSVIVRNDTTGKGRMYFSGGRA
jgi:hypothetical protein